jgi:hypothetical protein
VCFWLTTKPAIVGEPTTREDGEGSAPLWTVQDHVAEAIVSVAVISPRAISGVKSRLKTRVSPGSIEGQSVPVHAVISISYRAGSSRQ